MIDERLMTVFDEMVKFLVPGETVVIPKKQIASLLEPDFTRQEIETAVNELKLNELLQIKYQDAETFCLLLLPKGERENEYRENLREAGRRRERERMMLESEGAKPAEPDGAARADERPAPRAFERRAEIAPAIAGRPALPRKIMLSAFLSAFLGSFLAGAIMCAVILLALR